MSGKLVRGGSYRYINSKAVPTGYSMNPKGFWVHIMGPDFEPVNGIFALYSETGKYLGGHDEKLLDINPAEIQEEDFMAEMLNAEVEEVFEI
jgi:hypothetical protein